MPDLNYRLGLGIPDPDMQRARSMLEPHRNLNFVDRLYNKGNYPYLPEGEGGHKTHKMSSMDNYVFPTIVYDKKTEELREMPVREAYDYAMKTGEFIQTPTEADAIWLGGNYKKAFPPGYFDKP